jgi:hypothetical protein
LGRLKVGAWVFVPVLVTPVEGLMLQDQSVMEELLPELSTGAKAKTPQLSLGTPNLAKGRAWIVRALSRLSTQPSEEVTTRRRV